MALGLWSLDAPLKKEKQDRVLDFFFFGGVQTVNKVPQITSPSPTQVFLSSRRTKLLSLKMFSGSNALPHSNCNNNSFVSLLGRKLEKREGNWYIVCTPQKEM